MYYVLKGEGLPGLYMCTYIEPSFSHVLGPWLSPGRSLDRLAVHYIRTHCAHICWSLFQAAGENVGGTSI